MTIKRGDTSSTNSLILNSSVDKHKVWLIGGIVIALLAVGFLVFFPTLTKTIAGQAYGTGGATEDITGCREITTPGVYTIDSDVTASAGTACLTIPVDDVTVRCTNGAKIMRASDAPSALVSGVHISSVSGVKVENCGIEGFGAGIFVERSSGVVLGGNTINAGAVGISMVDTGSSIVDSNSISPTFHGISLRSTVTQEGNVISRNSITGGRAGIVSRGGPANYYVQNTITDSATGFGLRQGNDDVLLLNRIEGGTIGLQVIDSVSATMVYQTYICGSTKNIECRNSAITGGDNTFTITDCDTSTLTGTLSCPATSTAVCTADEWECTSGTQRRQCLPDGSQWRSPVTCPESETCSAGQCVASTPATPGLLGDVNGDDTIDLDDAKAIARSSLGVNPGSPFIEIRGKVTCEDGVRDDVLNLDDAILVARSFLIGTEIPASCSSPS